MTQDWDTWFFYRLHQGLLCSKRLLLHSLVLNPFIFKSEMKYWNASHASNFVLSQFWRGWICKFIRDWQPNQKPSDTFQSPEQNIWDDMNSVYIFCLITWTVFGLSNCNYFFLFSFPQCNYFQMKIIAWFLSEIIGSIHRNIFECWNTHNVYLPQGLSFSLLPVLSLFPCGLPFEKSPCQFLPNVLNNVSQTFNALKCWKLH